MKFTCFRAQTSQMQFQTAYLSRDDGIDCVERGMLSSNENRLVARKVQLRKSIGSVLHNIKVTKFFDCREQRFFNINPIHRATYNTALYKDAALPHMHILFDSRVT